MIRRILTLISAVALLILAVNAFASEGDSLWSQTYGGSLEDEASYIIPAGDGNFLLTGNTASFGAGEHDLWLVKVNANGETLWSRTYGGSGWDGANAIVPAGDGGFLLAGRTSSFGAGDFDLWLVKVSANGDSIWSHTYGGSGWDGAHALIASGDGGFLLAGWTGSYGAGDRDMWLVKVNADGDSLWSHTYGGSALDGAYSIVPSGDGGFLLAGRSYSFGVGGSEDMWLVKVNAGGDSLWSRTYGGGQGDWANYLIPSGDGGFLLQGWTWSFGAGYYDIWLVKVNANGDSLWSRTYGGNSFEAPGGIVPAGDGGFLLTGGTYSFGSGWSDLWLVKVNAEGDSLWSRTFGGSGYDIATHIIPSDDGGFLITGWTWSYGAGFDDWWLIKVDGIPDLSVTLNPLNPPVQIPAYGGVFSYNVSVTNNDPTLETFDFWIMVQAPNQFWVGPFLGPLFLTLPPSTSITRVRTQNVQGGAPAGNYLYEARAGDYPDMIWASDNFPFTKLGTGDGAIIPGEWTNTGEHFGETEKPLITHHSSLITSLHPNPFNPSTVISFELRVPSYVSLRVYDTAGRLVETLVNGWREAGEHEVTFDGSALPSGVYLYRLDVGEYNAVGKMVLLK